MNILQEAKLSPNWPNFALQLTSGPVGAMIGPICPQKLLSVNILQEDKLSPNWPNFALQLTSGPVEAMIGPICPQNLTVFAKTCPEITPTMSHWPGEI